MNAAVIGASSESVYAIKKAQELGLFVIALDGDENAPGLKYADASYVVDIRDNEKVAAVLDKRKPDVILPVPIGRYLITTGAMNERYGLKGADSAAADVCTDKYKFHQALSEKGLRNISLHLFKAGETKADEKELAFPLVAKPRYGSGSRGVEIYNDMNHLKDGFLSAAPYAEDYILESCVEGSEYGVDGMYINGEFRLILLRQKCITPPPYRQCVAYRSVTEDDSFHAKVKEFMKKLSSPLGLKDCVIHADIIRTASDDPFIIELSPRPSGHNLHNLFTPMAGGIDEVESFVRYALGMQKDIGPSAVKNMMIGYFDMQGQVVSVPDEAVLKEKYPLKAYSCSIKTGDVLKAVTDGHSLMGRGFYILEADGKMSLEEYSAALKAEFEVVK